MLKKINWDEVPEEQVNPSMIRKMVWGEKVMITKMKFKDGFVVPMHSHDNEQMTSVQKGIVRFWFGTEDSEPVDIGPGESVVIPGNLPHKALMIGDVEESDTFSPPRADWIDGTDEYLRK